MRWLIGDNNFDTLAGWVENLIGLSPDTLAHLLDEAFAKETAIDFAYPTQRFYDNRQEGKPEAGGPTSTS